MLCVFESAGTATAPTYTLTEDAEKKAGKVLALTEGELKGRREAMFVVEELQASCKRLEARNAQRVTELDAAHAEKARLEQAITTSENRIRSLMDDAARKDMEFNRMKRAHDQLR